MPSRAKYARVTQNGSILRQLLLLPYATATSGTRMAQHRAGAFSGFTQQYGVNRLVWCENHESMEAAIQREKRTKKWRRAWKRDLIERDNPDWVDLYPTIALGSPGFPRSRDREASASAHDDGRIWKVEGQEFTGPAPGQERTGVVDVPSASAEATTILPKASGA